MKKSLSLNRKLKESIEYRIEKMIKKSEKPLMVSEMKQREKEFEKNQGKRISQIETRRKETEYVVG